MGPDTPENYEEVVKSKDSEEWIKAMKMEMEALQENKTWKLVEPPKNGEKVLPCKWVYKVKQNADGSIDKYKACLVVKGFSQEKGVNYNETFSPVAKMTTIRSVLSVAAHKKMELVQFDVSTAFLYGRLEENENILMKQAEGFNDGTNRVCKLERSLYGLKQAARCWYRRFGNFLKDLNFNQSTADPCLFMKKEDNNQLILLLYVDDGLVASTDKVMLAKFMNDLTSEFKIKSKSLDHFLGLEIRQEKFGIKIDQKNYVDKILNKFNMQDCKPVSTPIISKSDVSAQSKRDTSQYPYRQVVGALMYLMVSTRPDIAFAVGVVSRHLENPSEENIIQVKRILRYLKGTQNMGIVYRNNCDGVLEGFSDADLGGDIETGRSTTGIICKFAEGPISWMSQRQTSVAISTTEAELVAASEAAREMVWLKRLYSDLLSENFFKDEVPTLYVDNEAAVKLARNPEYHRRTKHIRIRHFFVREVVQEGTIDIGPISTENQLADMLTKPLHKPRLISLLKVIGIE